MLVSAIDQHESAPGIHVSCPSWASLPPPIPSHPSRLSQSTGFELPASYSKFPLALYFAHGNVCVSMWPSQFVPPSPSPVMSTSLVGWFLTGHTSLTSTGQIQACLVTWHHRCVCHMTCTHHLSKSKQALRSNLQWTESTGKKKNKKHKEHLWINPEHGTFHKTYFFRK